MSASIKIPTKKIGLVSGLGPLAGSDVLAKIFYYASSEYGAIEDREYPEVILSSKGIDGFDNEGSINKGFKHELVAAVKQLDLLDADVIGIACNTAHLYYDYLNNHVDASVVNLIYEVAFSLPNNKKHNYLLLTSSFTRNLKLYEKFLKLNNIKFNSVDSHAQKQIDKIVYKIMGHRLQPAGIQLEKLLQSLQADQYTGIIAGCTELPLAFSHIDNDNQYNVIDSNFILAKTLTDAAYEQDNSQVIY